MDGLFPWKPYKNGWFGGAPILGNLHVHIYIYIIYTLKIKTSTKQQRLEVVADRLRLAT